MGQWRDIKNDPPDEGNKILITNGFDVFFAEKKDGKIWTDYGGWITVPYGSFNCDRWIEAPEEIE